MNSLTNYSCVPKPAIQRRVLHTAGKAYGLIFALGFAVLLWVPDAMVMQGASIYLAWAKVPLGLVTCLPIGMLTGWLTARTRWALVGSLLWAAAASTIAWIAGHIPYEGVSWIAGLTDPYSADRSVYPFSLPAAGFTGIVMVVGVLFGFVSGLLQLIVAERAWDRSTESHQLGVRSILNLCLCLPFAALFALFTDYTIHEPIRRPALIVSWAMDSTLKPGFDLVANRLAFLGRYRDELTPHYTVYWVTSDSIVEDEVIQAVDAYDVVFDSGFILRCRYVTRRSVTGTLTECNRLSRDLYEWMTEIATTGQLTCRTCPIRIDQSVYEWLAANLPRLGSLREVTFLQHQGGWMYQRATFYGGRLIDCRFSGDAPIIVDMCVEARL